MFKFIYFLKDFLRTSQDHAKTKESLALQDLFTAYSAAQTLKKQEYFFSTYHPF